mgnify:CR=1 FL=1
MAQDQAYLFIVFSLTGVVIGILFDFFRILRRSFKTSNIITYVEDVLFWILTGVLILYNIWYFNNGEIRIYMFLGIIMGLLIYMLTLSNIIVSLFSKILKMLIMLHILLSYFHLYFIKDNFFPHSSPVIADLFGIIFFIFSILYF